MKSVLQTLVVVVASTVLLTSCGHGGHGSHGQSHGKSCGCSPEKQAACQCDHKAETANKDGKKEECTECKKGS